MRIAVIGQGYVGLPLAIAAAESGLYVIGLDIDQKKIDSINEFKSPVEDISDQRIKNVNFSGNYKATSDFSEVKNTNVVVICVPTPLNEELEPDLSALKGAVNSVAEAIAAPVQIVGRSVNKITGALQGIDDVVTDAADRLGLSAAQLGSLSAGEIAAMLTISKLLPDNVSIGDIENRGIIVSRDKIKTTPPANTKDKLDETKVETSEEREARLAEIYKNNLIG